MKYISLTILVILTNMIYGQENFYYHLDEIIPIKINYSKMTYFPFSNDNIELELASKGYKILNVYNDEISSLIDSRYIINEKNKKENIKKIYIIQKIDHSDCNRADFNTDDFIEYFYNSNNTSFGIKNYFYVTLKDSTNFELLKEYTEINKVTEIYKCNFGNNLFLLKLNKYEDLFALCNQYKLSDKFKYVYPGILNSFLIYSDTCDPDDDKFNKQWNLSNTGQATTNGINGVVGIDIKICEAWKKTMGYGITVAVIDEGISLNNIDVKNNLLSYSYDGKTGTSPSAIYGNHGTQCAGIIGAEKDNEFCIAGVSPQCKLMSLSNDFNQNSNGLPNDPNLDEHLAQSIEKAANHGADVISNSWGGGSFSTNITNAINYAATQGRNGLGCSVIFASGNNNQSSCGYPSSLPNVIAVGAMDRCGYRSGKAVTTGTCDPWSSGEQGSNYGSELDVVAPSHVYSTSGYNLCNPNFGGTSSACPHVAGVAALVLSILPCASSKDVQDIIESTCQKLGTFIYSNGVNGHPNGSWSDTVGHGMIDASAAVNSASFVKNSLSLHPYIQNKIYTSSKIEVNPDFIIAGNNVYPNLFPFNSYPHGNVVIETNIAVKFKASQYIKIKEGFLAKRGSKFIAEVKKYNSIYGCRVALVTAKRVIKSSPISKNEALDILLYPNPFTANFFLEFDLIKSANVQIIISTITGQVIYNSDKFMENNHYKLEFERIGNDEILITKLIKGNEISIHKIIHTNNN